MQRGCQYTSNEKKKYIYIRNMNVFVHKQKSDHIVGAVPRASNLTANHMAAT